MLNGLALCAGGLGLEIGITLALPGKYQVVCAVERQAYAASVIVAGLEKTALGACPVWNELATFDPLPWRGVVDIITAGYPCQPYSNAGRRLGLDDPRNVWPQLKRIIRGAAPGWCFFENVDGHLGRGFEHIKSELEGLGYRVAAGIFSAAEVGAPHLRKRLFILAELSDPDGRSGQAGRESAGRPQGADPDRQCQGPDLADAQGPGTQTAKQSGRGRGPVAGSDNLADADCGGQQGRMVAQNAPEGSAAKGCCAISDSSGVGCRPELSGQETAHPVFARRDSLWPAGPSEPQKSWEAPRLLESGLGGAVDGLAVGPEQLHLLGSGVCPVSAAMAFVALWRELRMGSDA